jgi:uncharacterized protein (DUF983 family)
MHPACVNCGLQFEREQGYFVGAIYMNYGATAIIMVAGFFWLESLVALTLAQQLALWGTFAIAFPLCFWRYSRSLWLSLDYLVNPDDDAVDRRTW